MVSSALVLYQAVHFHMIYMHTFLRMTIGIKIKADKNVLQSRIRTTSLLGISLISNAQLHYSCLKIIQLPNTTEGGLKKSLSTDKQQTGLSPSILRGCCWINWLKFNRLNKGKEKYPYVLYFILKKSIQWICQYPLNNSPFNWLGDWM